MSKNDKKKVVEQAPPIFPQREEIPEQQISFDKSFEDLLQNFEEKQFEYFSEEYRVQIDQNFQIFDRDQDGMLSWEQTKELLFSLDFHLKNEEFQYKVFQSLLQRQGSQEGLNFTSILILLSYELKIKDIQKILTDAFKVLDERRSGQVSSQALQDMLQYFGYKYSEEQVQLFMKFADPKNTGQVDYYSFIQMLSTQKQKKTKEQNVGLIGYN